MQSTTATTGLECPPHAEDLAALVRDWYARGWAPATSTNFSLRAAGESRFWVSRSGVDKSVFGAGDFVAVDSGGRPLDSDAPRTSAETGLHAALYADDDGIGCVVHTHSRAATVVSRLVGAGGFVELRDYELLKAFAGIDTHRVSIAIPVVANNQDIERLAHAVRAASAQAAATAENRVPAVIIEGHGSYTWGASVADAKRHLEALEFLLDSELHERLAKGR